MTRSRAHLKSDMNDNNVSFTEKNSFDEKARVIKRPNAPDPGYVPGLCGEPFFKRHFSKEGRKRFLREHLPAKGDSGAEAARKLIRSFSTLVLIVCVVFFGIYYRNYRVRSLQAGNLLPDEEYYESMTPQELELAWRTVKSKYPEVNFPEGMNIKFAETYSINPDIIGWLTIPNTNIRQNVMYSSSADKYLYHNIYGNYSRYGEIFVDSRCTLNASAHSKNLLIYGHNTHDGLAFNQLERYMTVEGFCNAPVIIFETLYEKNVYKIFAVMLTNSTADADNGYIFDYLYPDFTNNDNFIFLMNQIKARSMIHTGVDIRPEDEVITLYTCYQSIFKGGRLVVCARKLREDESRGIDPDNVYFDYNAIFPQAYHDKMGY